jgi:DNA-binding NarL/FixJ family response regulator
MKAKIFIVEDHAIFRMGLSELINQEYDLEVIGGTDSIDSALIEVPKADPDLLVVDITLQGRNGIELIHALNEKMPELPMLVLSMHSESLYAERAFQAGAKGYIMKQETSESVVEAIRKVLTGEVYASQQFMGSILNKFIGNNGNAQPATPDKVLANREMEVFELLGQGYSTKDIADKLHLSVKTIGTYRERIKEKLNLKHATELVKQAVRWVESDEKGSLGQ